MTFTLRLTADSILKPHRLDQYEIEAAMLWPEDEVAREVSIRAAMIEYNIENLPDMPPDVLSHVRDHLKYGAPRIKDLQEQIGDRMWHGSIAGLLTLRSSVGVDLFGARPLGKVQAEIATLLKGKFQIEPKTMNNKLSRFYKYRTVAHLWAAYVVHLSQGRSAFPCSLADVPGFLATAEAIRIKAEGTRFKQNKGTVMRPGEAVVLPGTVSQLLPGVEFSLSTIPDAGR